MRQENAGLGQSSKTDTQPLSLRAVLTPLASGIALIAFAGCWMLYRAPHRHETVYEKYLLETFKTILQVGTVLFLGSVVSLLLQDFTYRRQKVDEEAEQARVESDKEAEQARVRAEQRTAFQKETLQNLTRSFMEIKHIHRLLAATGIMKVGSEVMVQKEVYDQQMRALSEAELKLETVWYGIINAPASFSKPDFTFSREVFASEKAQEAQARLKSLIENESADPHLYHLVGIMKDYLRDIIDIYEKQYQTFHDKPCLPLYQFVAKEVSLKDFLFDGEDWDTRFIAPYRLASSAIRKDILEPEEKTEGVRPAGIQSA